MGIFTAKSHGQEAIESIPAAMVGPAADATETISALRPIPRERKREG